MVGAGVAVEVVEVVEKGDPLEWKWGRRGGLTRGL